MKLKQRVRESNSKIKIIIKHNNAQKGYIYFKIMNYHGLAQFLDVSEYRMDIFEEFKVEKDRVDEFRRGLSKVKGRIKGIYESKEEFTSQLSTVRIPIKIFLETEVSDEILDLFRPVYEIYREAEKNVVRRDEGPFPD